MTPGIRHAVVAIPAVFVALIPAGVGGCARNSAGVPAASPGSTVTTGTPTAAVPPQGSLAAAMREWEATAGDHFKQSARALEQVADGAQAGDESAVQSGCAVLHDTNAIGLQHDLPTPDPKLTAELQRMIDDMNTATHACFRFALKLDPADAAIYQEYLSRAVDHLQQAKAILDADLGRR